MSRTLTPDRTAPQENVAEESAPPSHVETSVYSSAAASASRSKRYRLIKAISESQTSSVWRARDTVSGVDVAVKRLTSSTDDIARQRLADEAQVSERVTHPGLVPVLDSWFEPGEASLVFPYVPGETLAQRLHTAGPLRSRDSAILALDLADILAATHDAQLIHRDVKPGNVLLADDGRTRLVDFGISASGDVDESSLDLTGSGMAVGTLPYMAPEQLTGSTPTPAVDVYALGIVLYEMLSGARPYNGKSPNEQLQLQQTPPQPIAAPAALTALIHAALDPIPERRPSAEQLGRSLRAWLDGRLDTDAPTAVVAVAGGAAVSDPAARRDDSRSRHLAGAALAVVMAAGLAALAAFALSGNTDSLDQASNLPAGAIQPSASPGAVETTPQAATDPTVPPVTAQPDDGRSAVSNAAPGPAHQGADSSVKHRHHHGHHKHHHKHHHGHHGHG